VHRRRFSGAVAAVFLGNPIIKVCMRKNTPNFLIL
jgi:hypothetical protein